MKGEKYDQKVDSWALGIVIMELWLNRRVTDAEFANGGLPAFIDWFPSEEQLKAIKDPELREITRRLLRKDAKSRLAILDIEG